MSLCFRTLSGRLSSFVSGRKPLSRLDRYYLQKHVSSSAFLKQFLGTQRALSIRTNTESKPLLPFTENTLHANLSLASLGTYSQWNKKLIKPYNGSKNTAIYWTQGLLKQHNRLQKFTSTKNRKHSAPIRTASNNATVLYTQNVENDKNVSFPDNSRVISSRSLYNSRESNFNTVLSNSTSILKTQLQSPSSQDGDKPSQEKLQLIVDCLSHDLPKLFKTPQNFSIYTNNMIFINNIRETTTVGVGNYAKQLIFLRIIGHLKFAHVTLDILKITMHPEDATVKVRWRIRGIKGFQMIFSFWKHKLWRIQDAIDKNQELWYDGFSTYYINGEGKIYKHVADKVMPEQNVTAKKEDLRIAAKLALFKNLQNIFNSDGNMSELNSNLKLH